MSHPETLGEPGSSTFVKKKLRIRIEYVLIAMLSMSVALNVGLAVTLNRARTALEPPAFASGNRAPVLRIQSETGATTTIAYEANALPTLLYWFRPSCSWCEANFDNFAALAAQAPGRYRFLAISSASPIELSEYARRHNINFPLFSIDDATAAQYRLTGTPTCLLITGNGALAKRWLGAFAPSTLQQIEKTLAVELPGIVARRQ